MEPETLKRVQHTVEEILLVIDAQAKACGVPYYLFYGSALGAVRHHGFIPWDDDADIVLFRKDFEKLRATGMAHPVDGYFYQDTSTDPGYHIKITKIRKGTPPMSNRRSKTVRCTTGCSSIFSYWTIM